MKSIRYFYNCIDDINILDSFSKQEDFDSWFKIVKPILKNKEFQKRRLFLHHEEESLWTHSIKVSFESYKYAKKNKNINEYDCAVAGLLHDFYTKAWQYTKELEYLGDIYKSRFINKNKTKLKECHAFYHPIEALYNSKKYFQKYLNKNIENAIATHMFPLSLITEYKFPCSKESWVITYIDKKVSLNVLSHITELGKYVGIKKVNLK